MNKHMKGFWLIAASVLLCSLLLACGPWAGSGSGSAETPQPGTPSAASRPTNTPVQTATPLPTKTPVPTSTPLASAAPPFALGENPQTELVFTAPDYVWTLASDSNGSLYVVTDGGDVLRIDGDGHSEQAYTGLERCGFSRSTLTVHPSGDLVANTCIDDQETLVKIDPTGTATTLVELDDPVVSLTSDPHGALYIGTWTSEGNITLNANPTHLGGADSITGQVLMLSPGGELTTIYEGGIPVALSAGGGVDEVVAAVWGASGRFQPQARDYSVCSYLGLFWVGMSEQVKIVRLPDGEILSDQLNAVSAVLPVVQDLYAAVGMVGTEACGIHLVQTGQAPRYLGFADDEVGFGIMALTVADGALYFAHVNGDIFRVS